MSNLKYVLLMPLCFCTLFGSAQQHFKFNNENVRPGSKKHFLIEIIDQEDSTFIPVTIFHGIEAGPVLGITAGVHGYEYSPILAGQELIHRIDPTVLKGTVILVHAANVGSFLGRSPYVSPGDRKNLNRVFPGDPEGTITERIADYISSKVIPRCSFFVDAHSGDAPEDLIPYCGYYHNDAMPQVSAKGKELAMNLGFDYVLIFQTTGKQYMEEGQPSLYCSAQAFKMGIPSADIECGRLGLVEPKAVAKIVEGLMNMMSSLGMTDETPDEIGEVYISTERSSLKSSHTGFFYPAKSAGDYVVKGMKIGYITDFFSRKLEDIYAETDGVILYMLGTPPVNSGETLASIGIIE